MASDGTRNCSMRTTESYRQIGKKTQFGRTYLHHPYISLQQTIICHYFEDIATELQLRAHQSVERKLSRVLLGQIFKLVRQLLVLVLLPVSVLEVIITILFSLFNDSAAFQVGLIAQFLFKYRKRNFMEWVTVLVDDEEAAAALAGAELVVDDFLGWRYRFPEHIKVATITKLGRCWRMANDYRMRIVVSGHFLDCIPCRGSRALSVKDMYMNGRPEVVRTPVLKVIRPRVRLMSVPFQNVAKEHPTTEFHIAGVQRGDLFREFSLLCLRDRLVRDNEARSFGADPSDCNATTRFLTNYVRLLVQLGAFLCGHVLFSDNTLLERTAFALSLGLITSEMWAASQARGVEIPVGTKPGSPWASDREAWIRFRERRAPFSANMSANNSCWLVHTPDGEVDVGTVRADELAILHGVFVCQEKFAVTRVGFDMYQSTTFQESAQDTLCIQSWRLEESYDKNVHGERDRNAAEMHSPMLLVDSETRIGCSTCAV